MKKELLAPAGDIEAGYAALYYGADAVYLGLQQFSARATAANFGERELNEFVAFAHSLGRKVFVAVNTLVQEHELADLLTTLDLCAKYQVDAVIIQDLGVARIVRKEYPELEMHASTQMAVHNKEGALALQKIGFSRVVLARELHLSEIKKIAAIPGLETEAFIHGALCYSYSGLCLFSSLESGKSANRGKCLYPCRAAFDGEEGKKHYFSMKDMALRDEILKMPVTSLKIEGRKKNALYVAAVTDYYRHILDGDGVDERKEENIKQIYSRPWTNFHFNGKNKNVIDREFVGHRGLLIGIVEQSNRNKLIFKTRHKIARYDGIQIDAKGSEKPFGFSLQYLKVNGKSSFEAQAGDVVEISLPPKAPGLIKGQNVYLASSTEVKDSYPYQKPKPGEFKQRDKISVIVTISAEAIFASCGTIKNCIEGKFEAAVNPEKVNAAVEMAFAKTGETDFALNKLKIENPDGLFVPVSLLNELRRGLYEQIKSEDKHKELPVFIANRVSNKPQWIIKTDELDNLKNLNLDEIAEVIWGLSPDSSPEQAKFLPKSKLRLALPAICRNPGGFTSLINRLMDQGYCKWEVANYWGLGVLPESGIDLSFDASLYMLNSQAIAQAQEMNASRVTLALEDDLKNLKIVAENSMLPVVMTVYQDVPLFTSADCIRNSSCKDCLREERWINLKRDGKNYQALSKDCQVMLFADEPYRMAAEAKDVKVDFYRADFCYKKYQPREVGNLFEKLKNFEKCSDCSKAKLYKQNLL